MKHYLTACLIIKTNFIVDALHWISWHKYIGVEHFYILDDGCSVPLKDVLADYSDVITYIDDDPADHIGCGEQYYEWSRQINIYNRVLSMYGSDATWMCFIDDDEYIFPYNDIPLKEFLSKHEDKSGLEIPRRNFGPQGHCVPTVNHPIAHYKYYMDNSNVKSILNCSLSNEIFNIHRTCDPHTSVNVFGNKTIWPEGLVPRSGNEVWTKTGYINGKRYSGESFRHHDPAWMYDLYPITIHHFFVRSSAHIQDRLFNRGSLTGMPRTTQFRRAFNFLCAFTDPRKQTSGKIKTFDCTQFPDVLNNFIPQCDLEIKRNKYISDEK